jgi:transposase
MPAFVYDIGLHDGRDTGHYLKQGCRVVALDANPVMCAAAGDKGYSSPTARACLRRRHIRPVIPTKKDQPRQRNFDRAAYRLRNKVERLINRLKQARRVATRYEKRGDNYLAMVHIGMILLWLKPFADTA